MIRSCVRIALSWVLLSAGSVASAQPPAPPPPPPPPPAWDVQLGASFVGTSGNSDTSSTGADFSAHRRWPLWTIEATASAVSTTNNGTQTAERYLGAFRGNRKLSDRLGLTSGIKLERDRLAGIDFRSILDGGLTYALVRQALWTVDTVTALAWNHEERTTGFDRDAAQAVLQALSKYRFGETGDTTQRFTFYPDFNEAAAYRSEAELTAQAALNKRLALKLGFLWRYSHDPVPGFERSDTTTTASIVVRWQAAQ